MRKIFLTIGVLLFSLASWAQTYSSVRTLSGTHYGEVQNIRFSPNGQILASGGQYGKVVLWNSNTGQVIKSINAHSGRVVEVTFSPNGQMVASCSEDGSARVWDVNSGAMLGTYYNRSTLPTDGSRFSKSVSFVFFTADNQYLIFGGDGGNLMRAKLGKDRYGISHNAESLYLAEFPSTAGSKVTKRMTGGTLSVDGNAAVFTIGDEIRIVSVFSGDLLRKFSYDVPSRGFNDVVTGPASNQIATWTIDGNVTYWDYYSGRIMKKIKAGDNNEYSAAAFNSNGTLMVTGVAGNDANVWDAKTGNKIARLVGHAGIVRLARFSPVENMVATGSYDGTIRIWKIKEPDPEPTPTPDPDPLPTPPTPTPPVPTKTDTVFVEKVVYRDRILRDTVFVEKPVEKVVEKIVYRDRIVRDTVFVDKKEPTPVKEDSDLDESKLEVGKSFNLSRIEFAQGEYDLLPSSFPELENVIKVMQKYPKMEILLEGHTDNTGSPSKNMTLSYKRVVTVKNYICEFGGLSENRVKVEAFGETKPIAPNNNETNKKKNRRVEMKVLKL